MNLEKSSIILVEESVASCSTYGGDREADIIINEYHSTSDGVGIQSV